MRTRLLALASALVLAPGTARAQSVTLIDTAHLAAPRLRESSGIVASARPGVYWTHNDSGDEPLLYAVDSAGRDLGRIRLLGARAIDWEDIGAGPCGIAPGRCLYVGDIGDNQAQRTHVTVYRVIEPVPPAGAADTLGTAQVLDSLVFRYPGGPRDAEVVVVTPDGLLLVVSKPREGSPRLYWTPVSGSGRVSVTDAGPLAITTSLPRGRLVTGGAISPDGRWVVLRTYVSLHFFLRESGASLLPRSRPDGIPIPVIEPQGEGIAFDGPNRLVLSSEEGRVGRGLMVRLRVELPATLP